MFGKKYFATRKRLSGIVERVEELGNEVGLNLGDLGGHRKLLEDMRNPFLIVVSGEVNAGKSTLINGIFGTELCKANILPETDRVIWYRHGEDERNEDVTDVLQERYRSYNFLSDFNVVDTPGTNSVVAGHQAITERFLPVADMVLFVFPVSNPWGAATWDFISQMPDDMQAKIACVIQQKDLRDEGEVEIIVGHLKDLADQRLVKVPDVFAVSGKTALDAKKRQPFAEKEWKESGYPELENFISRTVNHSAGRRQILREVRDLTHEALEKIDRHIEDQASEVDRKALYLKRIEDEIDQIQDSFDDKVIGQFSNFAEAFLDEAQAGVKVLKRKLAIPATLRSLFKRVESGAQIEQATVDAVEDAMADLAALGAGEVEGACEDHWKEAVPRIKEQLGIDPEEALAEEDISLGRARDIFVKKVRRAARQAVIALKLRGGLELKIEERRGVMRQFVVGVLILLTVGGALGAFGFDMWAWGLVTGALIVGTVGVVMALLQGRALVSQFNEKLSDSCTGFESDIGRGYREAVRRLFSDYVHRIDLVRRVVSVKRSELEPRVEKWRELFLELKALDQEL